MVKNCCLGLCLCVGLHTAHGNQYDYLLFSNVLSDVQSGLNLNADTNAILMNTTPLQYAITNNNIQIVYMLLANGANVNAQVNGQTALHKAAQMRNPAMIRLLINAGANVNAKDSLGNTAMHYAAINNDTQTLSILAQSKADMNATNNNGVSITSLVLRNLIIPPIIVEDMNIAVSASAFRIQNGSVIFNVRNLTNEPLTILYTGLYMNGILSGEVRTPLVIPPATTITNVLMMQVYPNAIYGMKEKDGLVELKAGFNIRYQAEGILQEAFNSTQLNVPIWRYSSTKTQNTNTSNNNK